MFALPKQWYAVFFLSSTFTAKELFLSFFSFDNHIMSYRSSDERFCRALRSVTIIASEVQTRFVQHPTHSNPTATHKTHDSESLALCFMGSFSLSCDLKSVVDISVLFSSLRWILSFAATSVTILSRGSDTIISYAGQYFFLLHISWA